VVEHLGYMVFINQKHGKETSEKVAAKIPSPWMGEGRVGVNTTLPPVPIRYRARFRALPCTLVVQGLPPPLKGGGN